jgi:type VI secretion system protein ImpL
VNPTLIALILLLALFVLAVLTVVLLLRRSQKDAGKKPKPGSEPHDTVGRAVSEAFAALRKKMAVGKPPQSVPWVMLIGEPNTGKTTLLNQLGAGLLVPSPAADELQWRFLDRGAVIDVPGAFLITESGTSQPDGRWERMLRQLLRHRPSQPLNGLVLCISASQLRMSSEAETANRTAIAAAVRAKLDQLQNITGLLIPVYVLVTKCDQIQGFGNFCWAIDRDRDHDIFGWSNPNKLEAAFAPDWVNQSFDDIQDRLVSHQMRMFGSRIYTPADDDLFVFPLEFDGMRVPLRNFLTEIFHETAYVDSNFLRGIYFCGDSSAIRDLSPHPAPLASLSVGSDTVRLTAAPSSGLNRNPTGFSPEPAIAVEVQTRNVAFARDLFNARIFPENRIAQPVSRIQFSRRRLVFAAQMSIAIFALVFSLGTAGAWTRLSHLRDRKFVGLLNALSEKIPATTGIQPKAPTVQTAYDLVDTLGTLNASGFRSFFLPASWGDPLDRQIAQGLAGAFSRTVFPAISAALDQRARALVGNCAAEPLAEGSDAESLSTLTNVNFEGDSGYMALEQFVAQYTGLETAIRHYDMVRRLGTGGFTDLDALFEYLIGKNLNDAETTAQSTYYQRALEAANGNAVPITRAGYLNDCARKLTASNANASLISNFYSSWFDNNPVLGAAAQVADQIGDLEAGKLQSNDDAAALAQNIRILDSDVSNGAAKWLTQPAFDPAFYPALGNLLKLRFANSETLDFVKLKGAEGWTKLNDQLYTTGSSDLGTVLQRHGTGVQVSGDVISLEVALDTLLHQDFAVESGAASPGSVHVVWNKAALAQAQQLEESYAKYIHDQMPLLPPSLRNPVQRLAGQNLQRAVLSAVERAEEPAGALDQTNAFLEIRSFADAAPLLTHLQDSLPVAEGSTGGSLQWIMQQQSTALAKWLNGNLENQAPYPYALATAADREQTTPLTQVMFKTDTRDALEEYLAAQRERVRTLATDYAAPLAAYLQSQGLQHASGFDPWIAIIRDVSDYDAKKPGNSIASLENFIRSDLDKITPDNGCQAVDVAPRSNDYFVQLHANLESAGIRDCAQAALHIYTAQIADFFNTKLAGKFPFGPLPSTPGAAQADPYDVSEFLSRMGKWGASLQKFFATQPEYSAELAFVREADAVRQMMAGGQSPGAPFADVVVYFRTNQDAEKNGNQIIQWDFRSGDQVIHYPGAQNSLRWHYGDTVNATLRYAKDSPDIPRPGTERNARVDGRSVSWTYAGGWSLFALLSQHTGIASEFNATPQAMASTATFAIPTLPDTARERPPVPVPTPGETVVYLRFGLRIPDAKEPREAPIVAFPMKAPQFSTSSSSAE